MRWWLECGGCFKQPPHSTHLILQIQEKIVKMRHGKPEDFHSVRYDPLKMGIIPLEWSFPIHFGWIVSRFGLPIFRGTLFSQWFFAKFCRFLEILLKSFTSALHSFWIFGQKSPGIQRVECGGFWMFFEVWALCVAPPHFEKLPIGTPTSRLECYRT